MNIECRKTGFKADKHTFSPISLQRYIRSTQNNLQNVKRRTENAVKPVSKPENEHFCPYLTKGTFNRLKITSKVLKLEH